MIKVFAGKVRKTGFFQKAGFPGDSERTFGIYYNCSSMPGCFADVRGGDAERPTILSMKAPNQFLKLDSRRACRVGGENPVFYGESAQRDFELASGSRECQK
jgi:hypothetical protein